MSTSMIVLICVYGALTLVALCAPKPIKASRPTGTRQALRQMASWFFAAWVVSEFGSYALADYGVAVGYWQAFFGVLAIRIATHRSGTTWVEYDAANRHEQAED